MSVAEATRAIHAVVRRGDWLTLAHGLAPGSVDLLYADPPFNTGTVRRAPPGGGRLGRDRGAAFHDSWATTGAYIAWLRDRLDATLPSLKPSASVLLHVDWRTSHHVRMLLDDLLGPDRFVNHIVWAYGLGGSSPRRFARKHDDILFYCVDPDRYWFEPPLVPARSRRLAGRTKKATDVLRSPEGADEVLEIPSLNNMARERTGYPTQKPLALLELLVRACCPPGGLVLDPCCGSGTTLVAAVEAGRRAEGWDVKAAAVRLARSRLALPLTARRAP